MLIKLALITSSCPHGRASGSFSFLGSRLRGNDKFETLTQEAVLTADLAFVTAVAVKGANDMLLRGFTSVRDLGGPVLGLKRAIDMGVVPGPRIWPSGAMISQDRGPRRFQASLRVAGAAGQLFVQRAHRRRSHCR